MEITILKSKYPEILHGAYINCRDCVEVIEKLVWMLQAYAKRHGVIPCKIHQVEKGEIILLGSPSPLELKWAKIASKYL